MSYKLFLFSCDMNWQILHACSSMASLALTHLIFIVSFVAPVKRTGKLSFKAPVSSVVSSEFWFLEQLCIHSLSLALNDQGQMIIKERSIWQKHAWAFSQFECLHVQKDKRSLLFSAVGVNIIRSAASTTDACRWSRLCLWDNKTDMEGSRQHD